MAHENQNTFTNGQYAVGGMDTDKWLKDYNEERPHDALGSFSPVMYKNQNLHALRSATLHSGHEDLIANKNV